MFFFFKQKTAYEMRISDWSSDVCSSDLVEIIPEGSVQLNENSAKLITDSFFTGASCFAVRLITGQLFINAENVCFLTNVGAVSGLSHSRINIQLDQRGPALTVLQGPAALDQAAASMVEIGGDHDCTPAPNG